MIEDSGNVIGKGPFLITGTLHRFFTLTMFLCYLALACLVIYFPVIYMGEIIVYPFWRWAPLVNHMPIEEGLIYLFLIASVCTSLQIFDSLLLQKFSERPPE
jgi:hypothetical protein